MNHEEIENFVERKTQEYCDSAYRMAMMYFLQSICDDKESTSLEKFDNLHSTLLSVIVATALNEKFGPESVEIAADYIARLKSQKFEEESVEDFLNNLFGN